MIKSDIKTNTEQIAKYTGKKIDNRGWSWSTHMSHLLICHLTVRENVIKSVDILCFIIHGIRISIMHYA